MQTVEAVFKTDCGTLLTKGSSKNIEQVVSLPDYISAPVSVGQKIGTVSYVLDGQTLCDVDIVSNTEVKKISVSTMLERIFFDWFRVLR